MGMSNLYILSDVRVSISGHEITKRFLLLGQAVDVETANGKHGLSKESFKNHLKDDLKYFLSCHLVNTWITKILESRSSTMNHSKWIEAEFQISLAWNGITKRILKSWKTYYLVWASYHKHLQLFLLGIYTPK